MREFSSGGRCRSCSSYGKPAPSCKSEPSIYCHSPSPLKGPSCPLDERCCCDGPYTPCSTDPTRGYASDQCPAMLRWPEETAHQPQRVRTVQSNERRVGDFPKMQWWYMGWQKPYGWKGKEKKKKKKKKSVQPRWKDGNGNGYMWMLKKEKGINSKQ